MRPALTYASEWWAMKVSNKRKIATSEMRMLAGSSECRNGITSKTKKFDAYCAGVDMSKEEI